MIKSLGARPKFSHFKAVTICYYLSYAFGVVVQNKNTMQYVLDTTMHKQIQITYTRHEPSYKQRVYCGNRKGHHSKELRA